MRITAEKLRRARVPEEAVKAFCADYPEGLEPSTETLVEAAAARHRPLFWAALLPAAGPGSQRAFALWWVEELAYGLPDPEIARALELIRRMVRGGRVGGAAWAEAAMNVRVCAATARDVAERLQSGTPMAQRMVHEVERAAWAAWTVLDGGPAVALSVVDPNAVSWLREEQNVAYEAQLACLAQLLAEAEDGEGGAC